jgi:hypothetical protein
VERPRYERALAAARAQLGAAAFAAAWTEGAGWLVEEAIAEILDQVIEHQADIQVG